MGPLSTLISRIVKLGIIKNIEVNVKNKNQNLQIELFKNFGI